MNLQKRLNIFTPAERVDTVKICYNFLICCAAAQATASTRLNIDRFTTAKNAYWLLCITSISNISDDFQIVRNKNGYKSKLCVKII